MPDEYEIREIDQDRTEVWRNRHLFWEVSDVSEAKQRLRRRIPRRTKVKLVDSDGRKSQVAI